MPPLAESVPVYEYSTPAQRRRNRRWVWVLCAFVLFSTLFSYYAVRHGWIYPEDTTFAFPNWSK